MTTFLGRKPQEIGFTEVTLEDLAAQQNFVQGNLDCIRLPLNIDLWVNDEFSVLATNETLTVCILQKDKTVQHIFGNVFLASCDQNGRTVSLSKEQLEWIKAHSELFIGPIGMPLMIFDPYDIAPNAMKGGA